MQRGVAYKKLNQQVSIKHVLLHGQKSTKQRSGQTLSNKHQEFDVILMNCARNFWSWSTFGGHFVQIAVLWGMEFVCLSESLFILEVSL